MLAFARFRSALIVPDVVIGFVPPRESVEFGVARVTDVTVPFVVPIQLPLTAKHPPYGKLIPARVDVAVVEARTAEMNDENVEVPRSPTIDVVAVLPMNKPSSEEKDVEDADLNVWRPVQMFALARLRSALIVPDV